MPTPDVHPTRYDPLPHHKAGLSYTATGYGAKIPGVNKVFYQGRWRRIYTTIYSNSGTSWINVKGSKYTVGDVQGGVTVATTSWGA
jgi:hypothetical protein